VRAWSVFLLLALPLAAQQRRVDVFGLVGVGATYDDEGSLGKGIAAAGGIGYRLTRRFGVEGEVNAFQSKRDFGQIVPPFQHSGAHVMANALVHFGPQRSQFYLLGGVGLVHVKNKTSDRSDDAFNLGFGFGFKFLARERVYIRPDFRIFSGSTNRAAESPFSMLRVAIGAGYLW
jgi:opacity protein-like surface antigen